MDKELLPIPALDSDLLKALDQRFPDRCPDPLATEREIWMRAGERRLVNKLISWKKQQDESILTSKE